jgi:hypothetical protein
MFSVHYCEPMLEGMPERWSVVGMGPVAYCDSPRIAEGIAWKLNNGMGAVCPDCSAARLWNDGQPRKLMCHYCDKLLTI